MLSYLALGDSYTIGEGLPASGNFPHQLAALLTTSFSLETTTPKVIATTGWTTDELISGIVPHEPLLIYDFTTLLIGVNNQYRGYSKEQYFKEFTQLLNKAILHTKKGSEHVFVISIPDWGITPFAKDRDTAKINKEIAEYNQWKKSITLLHNCTFIDITPSSILHGADLSYLVEDGLHYNEKEYAHWAAIIAPIIAQQLHED